MCQRLQKSEKPIDAYGKRKFSGNVIPKHKETPMAQVEYPAKSQNICAENANTALQASSGFTGHGNPKIKSEVSPTIPSAIPTFINKPKLNKNNPQINCSFVA